MWVGEGEQCCGEASWCAIPFHCTHLSLLGVGEPCYKSTSALLEGLEVQTRWWGVGERRGVSSTLLYVSSLTIISSSSQMFRWKGYKFRKNSINNLYIHFRLWDLIFRWQWMPTIRPRSQLFVGTKHADGGKGLFLLWHQPEPTLSKWCDRCWELCDARIHHCVCFMLFANSEVLMENDGTNPWL